MHEAAAENTINVEPEALNTDQAALFCGLSRSFFLRLVQQGTGPRKLKIGKRTLFLKPDLRSWLVSQAQIRKEN